MFVINLLNLCKHSKSANQLHSSLLFIHLISYYFIFSFLSHFISLADASWRAIFNEWLVQCTFTAFGWNSKIRL